MKKLFINLQNNLLLILLLPVLIIIVSVLFKTQFVAKLINKIKGIQPVSDHMVDSKKVETDYEAIARKDYANQKKFISSIRASAFMYVPELGQVKVYLYSPNEQTKVISSSCGVQFGRKPSYYGRYFLILDVEPIASNLKLSKDKYQNSYVDLGNLEFIDSSSRSGELLVEQVSNRNMIGIYTFYNCSALNFRSFSYDESKRILKEVKFRAKMGDGIEAKIWDIFVDSKKFPLVDNGVIKTKFFNRLINQYEVYLWVYNDKIGEFEEVNYYKE